MAVRIDYDRENKPKRRTVNSRDVSGNPYAEDIASLELEDEVDVEEEEESLEEAIRKIEDTPLLEGETEEDRQRRIKILKKQARQYEKEAGRYKAVSTLKLSSGRLFSLVITGLFWSAALVFITYTLYMRWVKYPPKEPIDHKMYGMYCLENWMDCLADRDSGKISNYIGDKSYLEMETAYANSNQLRIDFFNKMLNTVKYTPDKVDTYNIYGNLYIDKDTDEPVKKDDEVTLDSTVTLSCIDYDAVEIDEQRIKEMLTEYSTSLGAAGYSDTLTDMFCDYMCNYIDIPIKEVKDYKPNFILNADGSYSLSPQEDVYLDDLLFSSEEFYNLLERFSLAAGKGALNPEWTIWSTAKQTMNTSYVAAEPAQYFKEIPINQDWLIWNISKVKKAEDEPYKYKPDYMISHMWCGADYLQNGYFEYDANGNKVYKPIYPPLGNGTFENPASLNTEILTTAPWTGPSSSGLDITLDMPISVKMVEFGVSEDALAWFESKDERNRGHDIKSELQFVYYVFEVKNLSDRPLVIQDNSALVDEGINLYPRTGNIYGLTSEISLNPGEVGRIESWGSSVTLNRLYVIWGANFKRKQDVIWFRELKGNIEDDSWNKKVSINTTREGEEVLAEQSKKGGYRLQKETQAESSGYNGTNNSQGDESTSVNNTTGDVTNDTGSTGNKDMNVQPATQQEVSQEGADEIDKALEEFLNSQ